MAEETHLRECLAMRAKLEMVHELVQTGERRLLYASSVRVHGVLSIGAREAISVALSSLVLVHAPEAKQPAETIPGTLWTQLASLIKTTDSFHLIG